MTAPTTARVTVEEFLEGDFPPGSWLLHGEVIVTEPTFDHQEICARTGDALRTWSRSPRGHGRAGYGGNWVLASDSVLVPDAWWVSAWIPAGIRSDEPPDLAVEVRSAGTWRYDIGPKRSIYEAAGVRELWLVDPPGRAIYVSRRSEVSGGLDDVSELGPDDTLTSPMLPGFELSIGELLTV